MAKERVIEKAIELSSIAEDVGLRQYRKSKLPNNYDDAIAKICKFLKTTDNEQRKEFVSLLDDQSTSILLSFCDRMSMVGVRYNSTHDLFTGLIALILIAGENNYQDILVSISLFYHSIALLRLDPRKLFTAASRYATSEYARNLFMNFLDRSPKDQRITAFGIKEIQGPNGLIYQFGNVKIPDGWM